ncbi:helix-turn-helix domain-containing protein [Cohnella sp. 56]|uniref:helix-turn-helix domain-containing protein n=1 Tax=Cohnella sp. 56 TaxID=3113722 RepID=UPI0030E855CB
MIKKLGQDFETLMREGNDIPEVRDYLKSFSVVLGDIVYARRMQLNLTQQVLADQAGTTQKRISLIESASGNVGQDVLDRVFRALGLLDIQAHFNNEQAVARA